MRTHSNARLIAACGSDNDNRATVPSPPPMRELAESHLPTADDLKKGCQMMTDKPPATAKPPTPAASGVGTVSPPAATTPTPVAPPMQSFNRAPTFDSWRKTLGSRPQQTRGGIKSPAGRGETGK